MVKERKREHERVVGMQGRNREKINKEMEHKLKNINKDILKKKDESETESGTDCNKASGIIQTTAGLFCLGTKRIWSALCMHRE